MSLFTCIFLLDHQLILFLYSENNDSEALPPPLVLKYDTGEYPYSNLPGPSSQVTVPTDDRSKEDPTYASVELATGKYTYNITTNSSYHTVMLHNTNANASYGIAAT